MYELYQIRLMLSQLAANGMHHQPYGPYHQQHYPPPPADYMGMVPRQQPPTTTTASTEKLDILDVEDERKPTGLQNQTVVSNSSDSANDIPRSTTNVPITLDNYEIVSDPTPSTITTAPTTRSLSFKPVQTKSLKTPSQKQIIRKKYEFSDNVCLWRWIKTQHCFQIASPRAWSGPLQQYNHVGRGYSHLLILLAHRSFPDEAAVQRFSDLQSDFFDIRLVNIVKYSRLVWTVSLNFHVHIQFDTQKSFVNNSYYSDYDLRYL